MISQPGQPFSILNSQVRGIPTFLDVLPMPWLLGGKHHEVSENINMRVLSSLWRCNVNVNYWYQQNTFKVVYLALVKLQLY